MEEIKTPIIYKNCENTRLYKKCIECGITVKDNDIALIYYIYAYLEEKKLLPTEKIEEWQDKALHYLKRQGKDTTDFLKLFTNTRLMKKLNIPIHELKEEHECLVNSVEEIVEKLEEI